MEAVYRTAVQDLVEEVQTPQSKGGNLPVDTSFLRNSGMAAVNKIPSGDSDPSNATAAVVIINQLKAGDRFVFGYTAQYARAMEAKYGFTRLAAQNWGKIVDNAVKKVKG
jgi:hypothetical protein